MSTVYPSLLLLSKMQRNSYFIGLTKYIIIKFITIYEVYKNEIDKNVYDRYQVVGITHLFALSGMHVGLLSAILFKVLYKLCSVKKYIIVDIFLLLYGFLVGMPASIRRCVTFFILKFR